MAKIIKRIWLSRGPTGHRVRKVAWGYTLQLNGKRERKFDADWTRDQAQEGLAARLLERDAPDAEKRSITFGEAAERYLRTKEAEKKRSIRDDRMNLKRQRAAFGDDTPLDEITASRIAEYKTRRAEEKTRAGKPLSSATVNRELSTLRHLLRLAVEEWQVLEKAPAIRLLKEPQGRLRFLSEDELARLVAACGRSQNPYLTAIVTVALTTGMRKGEVMGLTWERIDLSRGVILLERTKSGRRREIPMTQAVYDVLSALPAPKEGLAFRKRNGNAWGNIRTAFERACIEAKIEDFHFHDLRHTFASHFMMRGGNVAELKDLLGHADIKMTMRYAHLSPAHLRTAIGRMEGLVPASPKADAKAQEFGTKMAQSATIEIASPASA